MPEQPKEFSQEELDRQDGEHLPEREVMSLISPDPAPPELLVPEGPPAEYQPGPGPEPTYETGPGRPDPT